MKGAWLPWPLCRRRPQYRAEGRTSQWHCAVGYVSFAFKTGQRFILKIDGMSVGLRIQFLATCHISCFFCHLFLKANGGYGQWSGYGTCSKSCGGGIRLRSRQCNNPTPKNGGDDCEKLGPAKESRPCKTHACPTGKLLSFKGMIDPDIIIIIINLKLTHIPS